MSEVEISLQRDPVEQRVGVDDGVDRHADLADLAREHGVVGVVAEERRQVEIGREAGLAVRRAGTCSGRSCPRPARSRPPGGSSTACPGTCSRARPG